MARNRGFTLLLVGITASAGCPASSSGRAGASSADSGVTSADTGSSDAAETTPYRHTPL